MALAFGGAKHEHYFVLKQLLREALLQDKHEEAKKLHEFLEKTSLVDRDPLFMFKVGLELALQEEHYDAKVLRHFHSYGRRLPGNAVLLLEATTSYYIKHNRWNDAYDKLAGYLNSLPYSNAASLHGYAGLIAAKIAKQDNRKIIREKFIRKAIAHFGSWFGLIGRTCVDLRYFKTYINMLKVSGNYDEVRTVLIGLRAKFPYNIRFHSEIIEFSMEAKDLDGALRYLEDAIEVFLKLGLSPSDTICDFVIMQLRSRRMQIEEYYKWLRVFVLCLFCKVAKDVSFPITLQRRLIDCRLQYEFIGRISDWNELSDQFPHLLTLLNHNI